MHECVSHAQAQTDLMKARGWNLGSILKLVLSVLKILGDSDLVKGSAPAAPETVETLKTFGLTDVNLADLAAKGFDLNKILAFIMGVLKLINDLGIFAPPTTSGVPAE